MATEEPKSELLSSTEELKSELLSSIADILDQKLTPITNRLSQIEQSLSFQMGEINILKETKKDFVTQKTEMEKIRAELDKTKTENKNLKEQVLAQETYSRKYNVRLVGLKCRQDQNLEEAIILTLNAAGIMIGPDDIERSHFTSQQRKGDSRPILMRLQSWKIKQIIMKEKNSLRQKGVFIYDDYPNEILERRRLILPVFFKASELYPELNPRVFTDKVNIGGKVYTGDTIHSIPYPELVPEQVFTPTKSGIQAFYTKHSPLSNFYRAHFETEGRRFTSTEQYFVFKKALHFEDTDIARQVLEIHAPAKITQLGKKVQNFQKKEWLRVSGEYMFQGMLAKFSQNEKLKGFLLYTRGNVLVEASATDKFWGVELSLRSADLYDQSKWKGQNMAGKTLERVRQTLA